MADLDKQEKQLTDDIRQFFVESFDVVLTEEQLLEVKQSLFHLGRALVRWQEQQKYEKQS